VGVGGGVMVIWLEIETWVIGKGDPKGGGTGRKGREKGMGTAGVCGPFVCLGVFSLL
jgi:hypothetical protein